jgi:hypothetical protein
LWEIHYYCQMNHTSCQWVQNGIGVAHQGQHIFLNILTVWCNFRQCYNVLPWTSPHVEYKSTLLKHFFKTFSRCLGAIPWRCDGGNMVLVKSQEHRYFLKCFLTFSQCWLKIDYFISSFITQCKSHNAMQIIFYLTYLLFAS